jgi:hypothetical protein
LSDVIGWMKRRLGREDKVTFERFRDGLGNFELFYPRGWKFDEDIALVDGKYSIAFESKDGLCRFNVSVDAQLPPHLDFESYARQELESPESGIYTPVSKGEFHGMDAFLREYRFSSGGTRFFGGGVMFFTGKIVFSLSWSAPESKRERVGAMFEHMTKTIVVRESYFIAPKQIEGGGTIGVAKAKRRRARSG